MSICAILIFNLFISLHHKAMHIHVEYLLALMWQDTRGQWNCIFLCYFRHVKKTIQGHSEVHQYLKWMAKCFSWVFPEIQKQMSDLLFRKCLQRREFHRINLVLERSVWILHRHIHTKRNRFLFVLNIKNEWYRLMNLYHTENHLFFVIASR